MRRKPTSEKELAGTARADRVRRSPLARAGKPLMPAWLKENDQAVAIWRLMVDELGDVLTPADGPALALAAVNYAIAIESARLVLSEGAVIPDPPHSSKSNPAFKKNPASAISLAHASMAAKLFAQFGATPTSRPLLPVAEPAELSLADELMLAIGRED